MKKQKNNQNKLKQLAEAQGQDGGYTNSYLHNCIIKRTTRSGKVKIENIPPEEFLIQRSLLRKSIEDANFVAHRKF